MSEDGSEDRLDYIVLPHYVKVTRSPTGLDRVVCRPSTQIRPPNWPSSFPLPLQEPREGTMDDPAYARRVGESVLHVRSLLSAWVAAGRPAEFDLPYDTVDRRQAPARAGAYLLPRHIRVRRRPDGTHHVTHHVSAPHRPKGWPGAVRRLPITGTRVGSLLDARFYARVLRDAETLNLQLERVREQEQLMADASDETWPGIIRAYRLTERYLNAKRKGNIETSLKKILAWSRDLGHPKLRTFKRHDLNEFVRLQTRSSKIQVRTYLGVLLDEAEARGWVDENVSEKMPWTLPKPEKRERLWSREDLRVYQAAAIRMEQPGVAVALGILWATGQRINDVCNLQHGVNYIPGAFQVVQSKTGSPVPIPASVQIDEAIAAIRVEGSPYVITDGRTNKPFIDGRGFSARMGQIKAHLVVNGYKPLNARALRHTAICRMHKLGLDDHTIGSLSGHKKGAVRETIEDYLIDYEGMAFEATVALHVSDGGSEDDFIRIDHDDPRWQIKRRPDDFRVPTLEEIGPLRWLALKRGVPVGRI